MKLHSSCWSRIGRRHFQGSGLLNNWDADAAPNVPLADHRRASNLLPFSSKAVEFTLAIITFLSLSALPSKAEGENGGLPGPKSHSIADYSDPIKTYQTYLEAIKRGDLAAAKTCCIISDNNTSGSLDVLVGMWVTFHRFNKVALLHFNEQTSPYLRDGVDNEENPYLREDCTDTALNRTISRLTGSKFAIDGDRAKLTIKWEDDDGYPNQAFGYSKEALVFRKLEGAWKLDILPDGGPETLDELFKPGSWGCAFRDGMNLLNGAIEEIESGNLKTWQQVTEYFEKRSKVLEAKWVKDHQDSMVRAKRPQRGQRIQPGDERGDSPGPRIPNTHAP